MVAGAPFHLKQPVSGDFVELHAHSSHSLLDGVAHPEALVAQAAACGMKALALTDHDGLYGAVRFVLAAREAGVKPIIGAEVTLENGSHLTLLAETARGYANLCRLLTLAHRDRPKGVASLSKPDLAAHAEGLIALSGCRRGEIPRLVMAGQEERALEAAQGYARLFGPDRFYIELQQHYHPGDLRLLGRLLSLADRAGLEVVATGDVHYLTPFQREVHDVLTCIRCRTTLENAGDLLRPNDEYHFRSPQEMAGLFAPVPSALENTLHIAERCASAETFLISTASPAWVNGLPAPPDPPLLRGRSANGLLRDLCVAAMQERYPSDPPWDLLEHELAIIYQMGLADYFLIVWDIVRFAQASGIRCQGRGSAANSLVAYLLGITPIDPVACSLVFERFLSLERAGPPDIDIDFAADRREEVIQYVYRRYGEAHVAMACTLVTFRARSAVRDVARVLGFPPGLLERLAAALDVRDANSVEESRSLVEAFGEDLSGKPFQHLLRIVPQLDGIPRHLGIHNGGMVLSGPPLCERVPLEPAAMEGRVVTQWDKDSLEGAGLIKVDLLGLRILSAIEDAVTIIEAQTGQRPDLEHLPRDDPRVYEMICRGETVGVFQVESRAQASLIPHFKPRSFADLVVQISLIRPGPLQAQMVWPYLRRRQGLEPVGVLHPLLRPALEETLGVMVFQEQVLKVARDLAGFTPGEAELLRRALSHKRAGEEIERFRERFLAGAVERGVKRQMAKQVFQQLQAFGGYAFPKSHAAAFAVLTYQSAWLRCYHPAAFFAALLRHQPMGFYPAHTIVSEARRCGIQALPVDVEASGVWATVEGESIRLGLAVVAGLGEGGGQDIIQARNAGPFRSLADFCRRTRLGRRAVEALIWAGAFDAWGVPRRQLLWDLQAALEAGSVQGGRTGTERRQETAAIPRRLDLPVPEERPRFGFLSARQRLWTEVAYTGISSREHMVALVAEQLQAMGATPSRQLPDTPVGAKVWVGGVVVSRQRPPTAGGTAFLALEDEGGLINVVLRPKVYEASRKALSSAFVLVEGQLERRGEALSVLAHRVLPLRSD